MRPIKIKPLPPWPGDVRYEVLGRISTHIFDWTMAEVDAFLAQIAAERVAREKASAGGYAKKGAR